MIDALYNYRQGEIHSAEFSDEFNKLCIPFEDSLNEEQIDVFHKRNARRRLPKVCHSLDSFS